MKTTRNNFCPYCNHNVSLSLEQKKPFGFYFLGIPMILKCIGCGKTIYACGNIKGEIGIYTVPPWVMMAIVVLGLIVVVAIAFILMESGVL